MSEVFLTPDISRLAATYELGEPYAEFQASPEKHSKLHFTVTSCILYFLTGTFTLLFAVAAIVSLFDGSTYADSRILFGITIFLVIWLFILINGDSKITVKSWTIYACSQGILAYDARTQATRAIQWQQIKEFYVRTSESAEYTPESGVSRSWKCYQYALKCTDGPRFQFKGRSNYGKLDIGTLQHIIEKEIISLQLPPILEAYNEGKTVSFGALTINQTGVSNGQYTFAWDKILCIDFAGEFIYVRGFQWDVSFNIPKTSVPNAFVLEALVKRLDKQGKTEVASPVHMTTSEKLFSRKAHRVKHHRNS